MEPSTPGIDGKLLGKLRGLASRGATMHRDADGTALIAPARGKPKARMTPQEFLHALDAGWLTAVGAEEFVLSRRGTAFVRRMLNWQAGAGTGRPAPSANSEPREKPALAQQRPGTNPAESPLAWLRQRRDASGKPMISAIQFEAGERLRSDFELAQMTPRITSSWDMSAPGNRPQRGVPGAGLEISERVVAAHQRVSAAMKAVGPELSGVLIDVCCLLNGLEKTERNAKWPRRAGKLMLQAALSVLARHYRLGPVAVSSGPAFIRHWGADGYRPSIVGDVTTAGDGREDGEI